MGSDGDELRLLEFSNLQMSTTSYVCCTFHICKCQPWIPLKLIRAWRDCTSVLYPKAGFVPRNTTRKVGTCRSCSEQRASSIKQKVVCLEIVLRVTAVSYSIPFRKIINDTWRTALLVGQSMYTHFAMAWLNSCLVLIRARTASIYLRTNGQHSRSNSFLKAIILKELARFWNANWQ